jgi:hypothetical protein
MFFQPVPPVDDSTSKGNQGKALEGGPEKLKEAQEALSQFSSNILQTFTQGRERIFELQRSLVDALPNVRRLGGDLSDVQKIISGVAEASRRNVVASTEQIEKLYAIEKVIGKTGGELAESFLNVGIGIESIPDALEESIQYVQSIGGNAKTVFADVSKNMDQMNRFQFEDGVLGLTKMAAQASMMRVDLGQTLKFADDVLDPDRAIEVAGAFQRLGVAAGTLVDPFALMNASINDPSGLQDSLIEVSKQFTYFDDETKSFKINRQGVLTLREMEKAAGLAQGSMSKMGLAAAELDERLSQISPSIKFENEEDKQYLANIGSMSEGGDYVVKLKGSDEDIKLSEITQTEFNKLIDEQKAGSKSVVETAREQLTLSQSTDNNIAAIKSLMLGVTLTSDAAMDVTEGLKQVADATARGAEKTTDIAKLREEANKNSQTLRDDLIKSIKGGKASEAEIFATLAEGAVNIFGAVGKESMAQIAGASRQISEELNDEKNTATARGLSDAVSPILEALSMAVTGGQNFIPTQNGPFGVNPATNNTLPGPITNVTVGGISPNPSLPGMSSSLPSREPIKVEFGAVPPIDLNFNGAPQNMPPQQIEEITKIFERLLAKQYIKNYIADNITEPDPLRPSGSPLGR